MAGEAVGRLGSRRRAASVQWRSGGRLHAFTGQYYASENGAGSLHQEIAPTLACCRLTRIV